MATTGNQLSILLVDDRPENLLALEGLLGDLGHRLVKAESGFKALKLLLQQDFALILLDVQMPEMDGFETARLIRERERSRHTPIIFITANYQTEEHIARGYQAGALDYMLKPIQPDVLRAKVGAFIDLAQENQVLQIALDQQEAAAQSLRRDHDELELRVQARTQDLERANATLHREIAQRESVEAELRRLGAAKDAYLAMLGHELRNPLAALSNACYLLNQFPAENPVVERSRTVVHRQSQHLTRLVDDLLDTTRLIQGTLTLRVAQTDLVRLCRQAVEDIRPSLEERGHQLALELPEAPLPVEADEVRLVQIVVNLLLNAIKYTPPGGQLRLSLTREETDAVVRVQDNGMGLPADVLPRIFEPFFQAEQSLDRAAGGLGLGLTLAQTLTELHKGTLEAYSEGPGCGCEFVLKLPLPDAPVSAVAPAKQA